MTKYGLKSTSMLMRCLFPQIVIFSSSFIYSHCVEQQLLPKLLSTNKRKLDKIGPEWKIRPHHSRYTSAYNEYQFLRCLISCSHVVEIQTWMQDFESVPHKKYTNELRQLGMIITLTKPCCAQPFIAILSVPNGCGWQICNGRWQMDGKSHCLLSVQRQRIIQA